MTVDEALDRVRRESLYDNLPAYPVGSVAHTLAREVEQMRAERESIKKTLRVLAGVDD